VFDRGSFRLHRHFNLQGQPIVSLTCPVAPPAGIPRDRGLLLDGFIMGWIRGSRHFTYASRQTGFHQAQIGFAR
jgi:hypothetical protein